MTIPPVDEARLQRLKLIADWLDTRWRIPGTPIRIGVDGLASIVPGIGDSLTGIVAAYIVLEARRFGLPTSTVARMAANVGLDWVIGSIPVIGTLFDIGYKANRKNITLLLRHLEARDRHRTGNSPRPDDFR